MEQKFSQLHHPNYRKARILLREVDLILKDDGIDAAMKTLKRVRRKILKNATLRKWFRDYQKMLTAWQANLMPEVVAEFNTYGFRRARMTACSYASQIGNGRQAALYRTCEQVLEQMSERFRLSLSDIEQERPEAQTPHEHPSVISIDEVHESELEHGIKY